MGQVPENSVKIEYGIVGDGRVAKHFAHYFESQKIPFKLWSRRHSVDCAEALSSAQVILVLITDSEIEKFIGEHKGRAKFAKKKWVHFSGSLCTAEAFGAHPLMTFGSEVYEPEFYKKIAFVTDEPAQEFRALFPSLPNESYALPAKSKPLYHALCVLAGNFTTLLWQKAFHDFRSELQLPPSILVPYLEQVATNIRNNPEAALTGPLARNDRATIEANIAALVGDPYKTVYESFVNAYQSPLRGRDR